MDLWDGLTRTSQKLRETEKLHSFLIPKKDLKLRFL